MKARLALVAVVMLAAGAAAGFLAVPRDDAPAVTAFDAPAPVPARSPANPLPTYAVSPDPDTPALTTDLPLVPVTFRSTAPRGDAYRGLLLRAPMPRDPQWVESQSQVARWTYTVPENPPNTYGIRVDLIYPRQAVLQTAILQRISELQSALADGNFLDLEVEERDSDSFTASYIDSGGYRRVTMEQAFPGPDGALAYGLIAVYGREADRAGMRDLLDRISADVVTGPDAQAPAAG
ncbi:hypothetical protein [Nocardioides sp.]|uniref:hypothetical protein n=1 Tax=Nocardioides sp. TaxID=35761 RepID=UPI0035187ADC